MRDEAFEHSRAEVCALLGAKRRGTFRQVQGRLWGIDFQWLLSLLPAPGPPAGR